MLFEVAGPDGNAARGLDEIGDFQPAHLAVAVVARGHRLPFLRAEQHVFVEEKRFAADGAEVEIALGAEALQFIERKGDIAVAELFVGLRHFVVQVILGLQPDRPRL